MDRRELLTTLAGGAATLSVVDPALAKAATTTDKTSAGSPIEKDGVAFW